MYFHRFVLTGPTASAKREIAGSLVNGRTVVIPMVNPSSESGKALTDRDYCVLMSEYAEQSSVDLLFPATESGASYESFVREVLESLQSYGDFKIRDASVIIIRPKTNAAIIATDLPEHDRHALRDYLFSLFDALDPDNAESALMKWKVRRRALVLATEHGPGLIELVKTWLGSFGPVLPG